MRAVAESEQVMLGLCVSSFPVTWTLDASAGAMLQARA